MSTVLLRDAEVAGERVDVLLADAAIAGVEPVGALGGADVEVDCGGGAVLPGLHDHHVHLMAMAAAKRSVDVGTDLDAAVRAADADAAPRDWLRAVGYDESISGDLDRWRLDALAPGRPVRVQHRSGAMWVLSSAALDQVDAASATEAGIERGDDGQPTGRLFRLDGWLRGRLPPDPPPDLAAVGRRLAALGVTGVTDCTPTSTLDDLDALAAAASSGVLPLTVVATGSPALADARIPRPLRRGPVKVVIEDHDLPGIDELTGWYRRARAAGRPVAVHCVTRAALALAVAAWQEVGAADGDRVEHASVTPVELAATLAKLGVTVVTQPAFVAARGDAYLREVEPDDQPDLYRCASLQAAGVEVGGSTDAPFGPDDPWLAMRAAIGRATASGAVVGAAEAVTAAAALDLFLAPLERPGGPARTVRPGMPADLCVLDRPLADALADPSSRHVALTYANGRPAFTRARDRF
jgi:predicted amidohydrolase YtcJ